MIRLLTICWREDGEASWSERKHCAGVTRHLLSFSKRSASDYNCQCISNRV